MQQTVGIVKAFPYIPVKPRVLEVLAASRNEPPTAFLTQSQGLDDFEHNTNWQAVVNYLKNITADNLHLHVPLVDR